MPTELKDVVKFLFGEGRTTRFTQDSPILPEVWVEFFRAGIRRPVDLLLNPCWGSTPGDLRSALRKRLDEEAASPSVSAGLFGPLRGGQRVRKPVVYNQSHVVAELWFDELIRCALPLTKWWWEYVWRPREKMPDPSDPRLAWELEQARRNPAQRDFSDDLLWLVEMVGRFVRDNAAPEVAEAGPPEIELGLRLLVGLPLPPRERGEYTLWSVSLNRMASPAIAKSCPAVKADAARRVFQLSCKELAWAVVDSGVDASHPAFRQRDPKGQLKPGRDDQGRLQSRVLRTYDFSKLRHLLDPEGAAADVWEEGEHFPPEVRRRLKAAHVRMNEVKDRLRNGRMLEWEELEPHLRVPHDASYVAPQDEHGTHVAGVLGADWRQDDGTLPADEKQDLTGMCPDIGLYDLRVLDEKGEGTEFEVLAALQFIRYLNAHTDQPVVQGVNISLSLPHEVSSYACGRTPVCEECARLAGNGVVVVVAAGNKGHTGKLGASLGIAEYQDISITDPGNAQDVITVGATHRHMPHTYGVSYFSSRGPTGDGRSKPDLVAPGEKIKSTVPGARARSMDGTSMAAPHVSGAAALLMARHTELIGQPARVKEILCRTATDLGRERYFQGCGMVDILRAIQSV